MAFPTERVCGALCSLQCCGSSTTTRALVMAQPGGLLCSLICFDQLQGFYASGVARLDREWDPWRARSQALALHVFSTVPHPSGTSSR